MCCQYQRIPTSQHKSQSRGDRIACASDFFSTDIMSWNSNRTFTKGSYCLSIIKQHPLSPLFDQYSLTAEVGCFLRFLEIRSNDRYIPINREVLLLWIDNDWNATITSNILKLIFQKRESALSIIRNQNSITII